MCDVTPVPLGRNGGIEVPADAPGYIMIKLGEIVAFMMCVCVGVVVKYGLCVDCHGRYELIGSELLVTVNDDEGSALLVIVHGDFGYGGGVEEVVIEGGVQGLIPFVGVVRDITTAGCRLPGRKSIVIGLDTVRDCAKMYRG